MQSAYLDTTARFQIIRVLGEGATGRVFEAEDKVHGGRFALKRLRAERVIAPDRIARFKDEYRALEHVAHPNLAKVYELIADGTGTYVVMELIDGVDFVQYARPGGASPAAAVATASEEEVGLLRVPDSELSIDRVRSALSQLVSGLLALHALGKVHCDVKPDNVLVRSDGRVVLVDFGLTSEHSHMVRPGAKAPGTPAFMAPEQTEGVITEAADWYAVGVLLYLTLTGRLPLTGSLQAKRSTRPVDPRLIEPQIPDDLAQLALRLLEPNPAERPTDREIAEIFGLSHDAYLHGGAPAFVGRERELARLERSFEQILEVGTQVVHLHGESGIGKTALLRHFARSLSARGATVLRGACYAEASVPYKGLDSVIDQLAADLSRFDVELNAEEREALAVMFPVFGARDARAELDPVRARLRAVAALRALFERLARKAPVVVIIDDFQWADADSIDLLDTVLDAPSLGPLLCVLGYRARPAGVGRTQRARARVVHDEEVALGPLTERAIREIAGPGRAPEELLSIVVESRGNPFFLVELLRARSWLASLQTVTFEQVLLARIDDLSAKQRSYLELVSIAGRPVEERILAGALGVSRNVILEIRRTLIAAYLIRIAETRVRAVEAYHDRVRDHVLRSLAPEVSRSRHRALAAAYEATDGADPLTLAIHHRAAGNFARALVHTELAGDVAARSLAFEQAANLFGAACEMADGEARTELRIKQANAMRSAGRPAQAALAFMAAVEDRPHDVQLLLSAGDEFLRAGQIGRGLRCLDRVAKTVRASIPTSSPGSLLALAWHCHRLRYVDWERFTEGPVSPSDRRRLDLYFSIARRLSFVDLPKAVLFQLRYLRLAKRVGSRCDVVNGLALLAGSTCHMPRALAGGVATAERCLRAAERSLADSDPVPMRIYMDFSRGMIELAQWRLGPTCRQLDETRSLAQSDQAHGLQWESASCQSVVSFALWMMGEVPELRRRLVSCAADASGYLVIEATDTLRIAAMIALCDDRPEHARRLAVDTMANWPAEPWQIVHFFGASAHTEIDLYEGAYQAARNRARAAWKRSQEAGVHHVVYFSLASLLLRARAALAAGFPREAERDIRFLCSRSEDWATAMATALHAALCAARGKQTEALRALDAASRGLEKWQVGRLQRVAIRYRHAELERDSAAQQEALDLLTSLSIRAPNKMIEALLPWPAARRP